MRRSLISLLILALLAGPVWAAGAGKKPEPGTTVEMPYLMAPMSQDGKLLGYAYISSKLVCTSLDACTGIRDKLAFIQDAFVREVNSRPISLASDPTAVDRDLLNARLTANAKRIVGDGKVANMVFLDIKFAPLRPSESTAGETPPPDQAAAAAAPAAGAPANGTAAPTAETATPTTATSKPPAKQAQ